MKRFLTAIGATLMAIPLAALLLSACNQLGSPQTAQQKVFAAGTVYETAVKAALVYVNLPRCITPKVQPCSEPGVVDEIKKADNVAFAALTQAKAVVTDPTKTASVANAAAASVESALIVFNAVLVQYRIGT